MDIPEIAYGTDRHAEIFYDDCPEQVALDYFNYDGVIGVITIFEGTPYIPTNTDELEFMGETFPWLVKDIKPYKTYQYDEDNDDVIEVEQSKASGVRDE